jgi:hypothetical protein
MNNVIHESEIGKISELFVVSQVTAAIRNMCD